jgi:hypothetical protein
MRTGAPFVVLASLAAVLCSCESNDHSSPAYLGDTYAAFRTELRQCTARTGYDPERQQSLGSYDLGSGELQWRDCAYVALMNVVVPNTAQPELYRALIDKDRELTRGIQEKRITREQRDAEIGRQRQQILDREVGQERMRAQMNEMEERARLDRITTSTHVLIGGVPRRAR